MRIRRKMANNNLAIKILGGFVTVAIIGTSTFMGRAIDANDKANTKDHVDIRKEAEQGKDKVRKELMSEIALLRTEQRVMRKENNVSFTKVLIAIEKIKK